MVNAHADALGIIFPNSYDDQVPDLVNERLMASIPLPAVTAWWTLFYPAW